MATVYLAHDLKHKRPVALKVLHPDLAATLGPERFQREIETAAQLQHPHILTVHDSGDDAGHLWFTMPFVEGESLRARLDRERQLPLADAVRIAREAAQALEHAHRHGIIHRDIKPENLLLTEDGNTLVADFGIARSLADAADNERLTQTGTSIGTAAYMSPEQAAGERALDARSDIYSLATVLYEMLAGETPFTGPTPQAMIARRFTEIAKPLNELRDSVPASIAQAVQKALARTPADRYGSAAEFARTLETGTGETLRTAAIPAPTPAKPVRTSGAGPVGIVRRHALASALGLGLLIGGGALFAWRSSAGGAARDAAAADTAPRLAVLPFENLGDSADGYFADGITDAVRGKLTGLPGLQVIARSSSVQYRGTAKAARQVAQELGVRYLLTGTVRWAKTAGGASRVQVSPELVEISGDKAAASIWQQPFDASLTDVFQVQGEIAAKVADAMQVALGGTAKAALADVPTQNPAAYDAYLRGEAARNLSSTVNQQREAAAHYDQAVALDPGFATAWARVSTTSSGLYYNGVPTRSLAQRAREAAERAIALAPEKADPHIAMGTYQQFVLKNPERALAELEIARRVAPGDAAVLRRLADVDRDLGRWDDARRNAEAAYARDPRSFGAALQVADISLWLRRPADARPAAERALALVPDRVGSVAQLAMVALSVGDLSEARRVLANTRGIPPAELAAYFATSYDLGWVLDDAGQRLALTLGLDDFGGDRANRAIVRAQLYGWQGDAAQSRAWGDSAAREFSVQLRDVPGDAQRHTFRGLALAYAGHPAEALAEGERGAALTTDAFGGAYARHQLIRIHLLNGDHARALEQLMAKPYYVSPAWLRIDPNFAPLKGEPRFERLAGAR